MRTGAGPRGPCVPVARGCIRRAGPRARTPPDAAHASYDASLRRLLRLQNDSSQLSAARAGRLVQALAAQPAPVCVGDTPRSDQVRHGNEKQRKGGREGGRREAEPEQSP